jgi:hypothetical protein
LTPTSGGGLAFYRAINLNGAALVIDGNNWEGAAAPNYSTVGWGFCSPWTTLAPTTDAARTQMIQCSMQHWAHNIVLSSVPAGTYDVYVYTWLDWSNPNPDTISVSLEGQTVQSGIRLTGLGEWRRLGPYRAAIHDGAINITSSGGIANLSGVEVYRVTEGGSAMAAAPLIQPTLESTATPTVSAAIIESPPVTIPLLPLSGEAGEGGLNE